MSMYRVVVELVGRNGHRFDVIFQDSVNQQAVLSGMRFARDRMKVFEGTKLGFLQIMKEELPTIDSNGLLQIGRHNNILTWKEGYTQFEHYSVKDMMCKVKHMFLKEDVIHDPVVGGTEHD